MERKVLVVSVLLFILSSNVQAQDPCQKFHDKYQVCLEQRDAGFNVDYNACRAYGNKDDCEANNCYWNISGLPAGACVANVCYADSNADGEVDGKDQGVFKKDLFRADCPKTPTNPGYLGAPVPKTGQTNCYIWDGDSWIIAVGDSCVYTGQDGEYQKGVAWPNPRFTRNVDKNGDGDCTDVDESCDGTVTDNLTGLIWLKNANRFGLRTWSQALSDCNALADDGVNLTDGSSEGDWRLPNLFELESLRDMKYYNPPLSNTAGTGQWTEDNPFTNVKSDVYWSSTTVANPDHTDYAWLVIMGIGHAVINIKSISFFVWPVRGGQ